MGLREKGGCSGKVQSCRSQLRIASLYLCFEQYCKDDGGKENWIAGESVWCDEHAGVMLPSYHDVLDRWTPHNQDKVKTMGTEMAMSFPVLGEVVVLDASFFDRAFKTINGSLRQYDLHLAYAGCMYYFWIVVITIGTSMRLLLLIANLRHERPKHWPDTPRSENHPPSYSASQVLIKAWLKRYITVPATFGNLCSQPHGWCTIPPRIQSITILVFIALNVILSTCSYELVDGSLWWPKKSAQLLRFVSDRTGILSLANFPLVWLFGMRNDLLLWMTGWGFGTYNAFHRWLARVATLQAVVHSIGYTFMILESGGWSHFLKYWTKHYFWNGELSTVAMCALLAFSLYGIRRAHYEIFLVTHIVLSIVALWTMYYHVEIFTNGEWNIFIWPCLATWILDRALRLGRVLLFNRHFWNTQATVSYDPSSNLVRMDVDGRHNWISTPPGTYYYIHVLSDVLYAHQSHPFTLAYTSSDTSKSTPMPLSPLHTRPTPSRISSNSSGESDALLASTSKDSPTNLVFLIRPYDGFTDRLKSSCLLHPKQLRVLVEGPYGHSEPFHLFPNILFVVGGTGIAVPLSHLARLLSSRSHVQSVKIVWAVREHAFLASVLRDFAGLLGDERVDMEVHITQEKEVEDEVLGEDMKSVRIVTRRPDVYGAVQEVAQGAGQQPLAVVACGPAGMADQTRASSVKMLAKGYRGVEYFEESFKW
ncbi:ferric-chelate reductase-like protein [Setomelanomma holmii]|uniref:Ferric-chelate reductase-like protein n=1 Tax=Setomelanomma holmii TaxID=210430 RepID=A0A9P4LI48_9PLEO|nr:ferric-chelate reductase-like protein [Setomelanomma holmii]